LVHRGAPFFQAASAPGLLYTGVIASENPRARRLLTGERLPGGLHAHRVSGMTTCAILLRRARVSHPRGLEVQPATPEMLPEIVEFLRTEGARRQFFPAYTLSDFTGGTRLRGLRPQDIMVARRGTAIAGVMAAWDQSAFKQDIVDSYGPALRPLRPALDTAARLLGARPLTPPGRAIALAFAACICVAEDDPDVMRALLRYCEQHAHASGKAYLMVGLVDSDPLLKEVERHPHITYRSDLFAVAWSEEPLSELDERMPYIEIATL
jgi:hypothetical protein